MKTTAQPLRRTRFGPLPHLVLGLPLLLTLLAADASKPHPHRGVLKPYKGAPPAIKLSAGDEKALASGEAVHKQIEGDKGGRGMAIQDMHATPKEVWARISDYPAYPRMVENVKECSNYLVKGERIKTRFVIGTFGLSYEYFIDHTFRPEQNYMTWTLDYDRESDFDDSVGYWYVIPHPKKEGWSRVYYSVDIKLRGWVPGFIQSMLRDEGLKRATRWVKKEAERTK